MSSDNHLIWMFVAVLALIEVVSRKPILKVTLVSILGFSILRFSPLLGEDMSVAFDTRDEKIVRIFLL